MVSCSEDPLPSHGCSDLNAALETLRVMARVSNEMGPLGGCVERAEGVILWGGSRLSVLYFIIFCQMYTLTMHA